MTQTPLSSQHLLFLHGGPGYPDYLREYFEGEFATPFSTTFYNQTGGEDVDLPQLIAEAEEKLATVPATSHFLVGHSWGGALAVEVAHHILSLERSPEARSPLRGIVLIDACLDRRHIYEDYERELLRRNIAPDDIDSIFFTEAEKPAGRNLLARIQPRFDEGFFARLEASYMAHLDLLPTLDSLTLPVLNIFGTEDVRVPASSLAQVGQERAHVKSVAIEGAGHFPFVLESPRRQIVEAMKEFFHTA